MQEPPGRPVPEKTASALRSVWLQYHGQARNLHVTGGKLTWGWAGGRCRGGKQTCVGAGMPLELVAPCEPLATEEPVADKGPLAGVQAHVSPQQGRLTESLAAVRDVAHVLLFALLSRPGRWVEGRVEEKQREREVEMEQDRREDVGSGWRAQEGEEARWQEPLPHPLSVSQGELGEQGTCWAGHLASCLKLPLVPVLAVGTRAGHAAPLLPRLGLSSQGLFHLQLDLGGAQPTDGQVVPRNILHSQLLLSCGEDADRVQGEEAQRGRGRSLTPVCPPAQGEVESHSG